MSNCFKFHLDSGEARTVCNENIYEALEIIVRIMKIHPRIIKSIERMDESA